MANSKVKSVMFLFIVFTLVGAAQNANAAVLTINFDDVDAFGGPITGSALDTYLGTSGITISDITPSGLLEIVDDRVGFPSTVLRAFSDYNVLWHDSPNAPYSYTVNFTDPLDRFSFVRAELFGATPSGLIVAPWRARAFNSLGVLVDTVSEPQLAFFGSIPAAAYTLTGPDIVEVVFDRTTTNTVAGLNRVPTDNWELEFTPAPVPTFSTYALVALLLLLAGAVGYRVIHQREGVRSPL